jgi:hypothetical protein
MRLPTRTASLVIGTAALVAIAAGTGATAATLITGKQIKDGTVTGADIKNGSIRSADVEGGYFTKAQTNGKFRTSGWLTVPPASFRVEEGSATVFRDDNACVRPNSAANLVAGVPLPTGVTITGVRATVRDSVFPADNVVKLMKRSGDQVQTLATLDETPATTAVTVLFRQLTTPDVVNTDEYFWLEYSSYNTGLLFCGASVQYRLPGGSGVRSVL